MLDLEETPFEKITLTQLCDASMVPRSTFYRYFEDKYDLLYYCLQTFFDTVRGITRKNPEPQTGIRRG